MSQFLRKMISGFVSDWILNSFRRGHQEAELAVYRAGGRRYHAFFKWFNHRTIPFWVVVVLLIMNFIPGRMNPFPIGFSQAELDFHGYASTFGFPFIMVQDQSGPLAPHWFLPHHAIANVMFMIVAFSVARLLCSTDAPVPEPVVTTVERSPSTSRLRPEQAQSKPVVAIARQFSPADN